MSTEIAREAAAAAAAAAIPQSDQTSPLLEKSTRRSCLALVGRQTRALAVSRRRLSAIHSLRRRKHAQAERTRARAAAAHQRAAANNKQPRAHFCTKTPTKKASNAHRLARTNQANGSGVFFLERQKIDEVAAAPIVEPLHSGGDPPFASFAQAQRQNTSPPPLACAARADARARARDRCCAPPSCNHDARQIDHRWLPRAIEFRKIPTNAAYQEIGERSALPFCCRSRT